MGFCFEFFYFPFICASAYRECQINWKIKKREKEAERKRPSIKKGEKTLSGSISKFKKMQKKYRKTPRKTPRKNEFGSIE